MKNSGNKAQISQTQFSRSGRQNYAKQKRKNFSSSKVGELFEYGIDLENRLLYIGTQHFDSDGDDLGVDSLRAEYVIKGLHFLNYTGDKPIKAVLFTPGGSVTEGWAIYDAIRASAAPVDIEVLGEAMSTGAIILQAGRERIYS